MAKLLLMEDDTVLAFELAASLKDAGHEVVVTASANEAREKLWHWDIDLLISDIVVRQGDRPVPDGGLSLISWVRYTATNTLELQHIPIIAISGEQSRPGMDFILPTAARIGADLILEKPIDISKLLQAITDLLSQKSTASSAQ